MLFDACTIGGIDARCRIVRSATFEGMADAQGQPTEKLASMYKNLAAGGTGVMITGMIAASKLEPHQHNQILLDDDSCIAPLADLITQVHDRGGKIVAQIVIMGSAIMVPERENRLIVSPSGVPDQLGREKQDSTALSEGQIRQLVADAGQAARRAKAAGFDGVQFHGAHGYLASKFLTPFYNTRTDAYGGSLENRARFLRECIAEIRKQTGADYPVWVKLNCSDFMKEGGLEAEESLQVMKWLAEDGVQAIEVSGGNTSSLPRKGPIRAIRRTKEPMYFAAYAKAAAAALKGKTDVGVVGGWRAASDMEEALATSDLSFISLCRPLLRQPDLPNLWRNGSTEPATCISCNRCFRDTDVDCIFHEQAEA
ncbi:NADH:flavin oxidoreductase [uncultured Megasphaera sp.]|uniref:NADH:flavin oxidoreductase n=1 Tax=uncultured Megasphaera sp. TaxID=165188 RepID=UPI00259A8CCF|nr:NADH:flavin oxidoreductase [uncultured Megasphaera sp.]